MSQRKRLLSFDAVLKARLRAETEPGGHETLHRIALGYAMQRHKSGFAIIPPDFNALPPQDRKGEIQKFEHMLSSWGYGYLILMATWVEWASRTECREPVYLIFKMSLAHAVKAQAKYAAPLILHAAHTSKNVKVYSRSGMTRRLGRFQPEKIALAYSQLKPGWQFLGFDYPAQTISQAWAQNRFDAANGKNPSFEISFSI